MLNDSATEEILLVGSTIHTTRFTHRNKSNWA